LPKPAEVNAAPGPFTRKVSCPAIGVSAMNAQLAQAGLALRRKPAN
jgi:hypothetical protein